MNGMQSHIRECGEVTLATMRQVPLLIGGSTALIMAGAAPAPASAQQPATALVFEGVTVVDVEQGKLVPDQRVVITGNRIAAMGGTRVLETPLGAQVVDARGKYLMPGLWDLHVHSRPSAIAGLLLMANGVTGIRDAGSSVPLDTLVEWRREILAGVRIGPPRQLLSGESINDMTPQFCGSPYGQACYADAANPNLVDSLQHAGADMIKIRFVNERAYFTLAAEARRRGIPFGGHVTHVTALAASDSGATIIDHMPEDFACRGIADTADQCRSTAERFRRNGTWLVPTYLINRGGLSSLASWPLRMLQQCAQAFSAGALLAGNWLRDAAVPDSVTSSRSRAAAGSVRLPILAGTDARSLDPLLGFSLHAELALYVVEGLTPLEALQSATLNPATMWHATDSLGTVAPGKLADLVLLDADPLADITNTTTIRAVVANGRYFDRAALDKLLAEVQAKAKGNP